MSLNTLNLSTFYDGADSYSDRYCIHKDYKQIKDIKVDERRYKLANDIGLEYIGTYKYERHCNSIQKVALKSKNGICFTMTDSALEGKSKRVKNGNDYYRSLPEDFANDYIKSHLSDEDMLLREVSLEGLLLSDIFFKDKNFYNGCPDIGLINKFKRAINDFVIQVGDRTIVLSIAGKGHHDKYDSFLRKINKSYLFRKELNISFKMIKVPYSDFYSGKVDFYKFANMLKDFLINDLSIDSSLFFERDILSSKANLFNSNVNNLLSKICEDDDEKKLLLDSLAIN